LSVLYIILFRSKIVATPTRISLAAAVCAASLIISATPAQAGQVSGWWGGNWTCTIDGRPARMKWVAVDDTTTHCNGDVCTSTSGARWKGSFSDNGSQWVDLRNPRRGDKGGLYFNHADGNRWYLPKPAAGRTSGWTTWNGKRYPLSCWR
jgi:Family of unknown function (DUF6006)